MTEEIIIDGVNVSGCKEVFSSLLPIGNAKVKCRIYQPSLCKEFPNCYFKQLKRAEQKLERIEDRVQDLDNYSEKNVEIMEDILTIIQGE